MNIKTLLSVPIANLAMSDHFLKTCQEMGYQKLEDILGDTPGTMRGKKGFNYRWLEELSRLLSEHGLLDRLQPIPGKIHH